MKLVGNYLLACFVWLLVAAPVPQFAAAQDWPAPTNVNRPWTRWWWHGSAVDEANLTRELEAMHAAGIGGVEITPIYGVQGEDAREVPYLSPRWIELANFAIPEAKRLGMGVDLPPGTGWRMGGPWVKPEDGNAQFELNADDIRPRLIGEKVKRPAPGGEGLNINPYAAGPTQRFLNELANRAQGLDADGIRASFHDSFEYEGNWCDGFFDEFAMRRGYSLQSQLPALAGRGEDEQVARVKSDFRETISDLVQQNLIGAWVGWSHDRDMLARNQAHGSPGNWLDLYAACDIPETESFGRINADPLRHYFFKFASSAAHVAGRPLVSSETATWLDEHFNVTLQQIKWIVDLEFLSGVNHVFFHGTAYSPQDAAWPGWVFYASTQLNPRNPIWRDLPELNTYITRCQSLLQAGKPDNDVLIYWPIYDIWHDPDGLMMKLTVHNGRQWFGESSLYEAVKQLDESGVTYDFVSDLQLAKSRSDMGRVVTEGSNYAAVLVPTTRMMPLRTFEHLLRLVERGALVGFVGELPEGPPGLMGLEQQQTFDELKATLKFEKDESGQSIAKVSQGEFVLVDDLLAWAKLAGCRIESWSNPQGLTFIRRQLDDGVAYFVRNESDEPFDGWIAPATAGASAVLMDPVSGMVGVAAKNESGAYRVQLRREETTFLKTTNAPVRMRVWNYRAPIKTTVPIDGPWHVEFIAGGPTLPEQFTTDKLESWTKSAGAAGESFAGTARYSAKFDVPQHEGAVRLNLGEVADSARVFLNGRMLGVLIGPQYAIELKGAAPGENQLDIEVTNVAANRIRDLDRREVRWRMFKDINFVNIDYQPFDASNWPIRDAGLLGPVTIQLLKNDSKAPDSDAPQ